MRYRYLDDFRRGISVFAIFSYGIAVLGTPQCPPPISYAIILFEIIGQIFRESQKLTRRKFISLVRLYHCKKIIIKLPPIAYFLYST